MLILILLVYLITALTIQIFFFLIEKIQKSIFDEIFKEYADVNPHTLINIASFIPIYNIYFLVVLIYAILQWALLSIIWVIKGGNKK